MSPIKDAGAYPEDWQEIRAAVLKRAADTDDFWPVYGGGDEPEPIPRCECRGECGGWHAQEDEGRCLELHGGKAAGFKGDVVLTVAHLDREPAGRDMERLRAYCQKCHLNYDREDNRIKATATRTQNRAAGTSPLFDEQEINA